MQLIIQGITQAPRSLGGGSPYSTAKLISPPWSSLPGASLSNSTYHSVM